MSFCLGIVIPLKAMAVSNDWDTVCSSLQATLNSVLNQNTSDYKIVVVGHDCPKFLNGLSKHGEEIFLNFDEFDPPNKDKLSETVLQAAYEFDRCSKIGKGMMHLTKSCKISHWFALDADDLLSRDFVQEVRKIATQYDAISLTHGYMYYKSLGFVNHTNQLDLYCGSSCVISANITKPPKVLDRDSYKEIIFVKYSHVHIREQLKKQGYKVYSMDTRLVTYVRENGENISGFYRGYIGRIKLHIAALIRHKRISKEEKTRLNIV